MTHHSVEFKVPLTISMTAGLSRMEMDLRNRAQMVLGSLPKKKLK